jgi:hypothetical protein
LVCKVLVFVKVAAFASANETVLVGKSEKLPIILAEAIQGLIKT